jgi:predicted ester cyclase
MSDLDANRAVIARLVAAMEQDDDATLRQLYAPDHVMHQHWHAPLPLPGTDEQPLLDRYQQLDAKARADVPDMRYTIEEQIACGEWVVTVFTARGTHARRGTAIEERGISADRIVNGSIVESWMSADRLGVLQQLGVVGSSRELYAQADLTL